MITIECFDYAEEGSGPDLRVTFEVYLCEDDAWRRVAFLADELELAERRIPPGDDAVDADEGDDSTRVWTVTRHPHPGVF